MAVSQYIIHDLYNPEDPRYWRLHWFEQLTFNQKTREPLLEALFVPLKRTDLDIDSNPPELLDNRSYNFHEARKIEVGGGLLPVVHIGLLLRQGSPVKRPRYQRKIFKLFIGRRSTEVLPIKHGHKAHPDARKIYDIPYHQYELGGTNDYMRCLHIQVSPKRSDGITKVIIPCAELIRFHYGNSSELFHEVLTNGLAGYPNRVFNPAVTVRPGQGRTPFIQLSPYVTKRDAPIVARYAFDRRVLNQGQRIYTSATYNAGHPYPGEHKDPQLQGRVPEVGLPYENVEARLVVCGKEIISGDRKHFLVYYIESDSTPFPFDYFEFTQEGDETIHVVTDSSLPDAGRGVRVDNKDEQIVTVNDEVERVFIKTDKEPSPVKERVEEILWEDKFPDLRKKRWRERDEGSSRTRPPRREPSYIQGHDEEEDVSTAPTGESDNKVGGRSFIHEHDGDETSEPVLVEVPADEPVDEETPTLTPPHPRHPTLRGKALRASYELFEHLVNLLGSVWPERLNCEIAQVPKRREVVKPVRSLSEFPTEWEDSPVEWSIVTRDGETRPRRLIAARGICLGRHYFYMLEIEPPERDEEKELEALRSGQEPPKVRTYTMLLVHKNRLNGFAEMTASDLRQVLVTCAWNRGSWLKPRQLEHLGWYKFRHASSLKKDFVKRILEYLEAAGLLPLAKAEFAEMLRRLNEVQIGEPSQVSEQAQAGDASTPSAPDASEGSPQTSEASEGSQVESTAPDELTPQDEDAREQ